MGTIETVYSFSGTVLVYRDGTLAITDSDIKGLIIEVDTFPELFVELTRVVPHLLELNHNLDVGKLSECELHLDFVFVEEPSVKPEQRDFPSFPEIRWSKNGLRRPLQFA